MLTEQTIKILLGLFVFELSTNGFHQHKQIGSVMFRDAITDEQINAFSRSAIPGSHHIQEEEDVVQYPWAKNIQAQLDRSNKGKEPDPSKTLNKRIVWKAMVIISHEYDERCSPESLFLPSFSIDSSSSSLSPLRFSLENDYPEAFKKMNQVVEKLDTLFSKREAIEEETNRKMVENRCLRWRLFFSRFDKIQTIEDNGNSKILHAKELATNFVNFLRIVRDLRKKRNGNPKSKGLDDSEQAKYNDDRERNLKSVFSIKGYQMYIRETDDIPIIKEEFHEGIPIVNYTSLKGLRSSLQQRESHKRKRNQGNQRAKTDSSVQDMINGLYGNEQNSQEKIPTRWKIVKVMKDKTNKKRQGEGVTYKNYQLMKFVPVF